MGLHHAALLIPNTWIWWTWLVRVAAMSARWCNFRVLPTFSEDDWGVGQDAWILYGAARSAAR
jgi:hypothetical protein